MTLSAIVIKYSDDHVEVEEVNPFTLHSLKQCVGFLYREEFSKINQSDLDKKPEGTCFFVARFTPERLSNYLVTAKHVWKNLKATDGQMFVRLNRINTGVLYVPLPKDGWVEYPDENVDLVVLPWLPGRELAKQGGVTLMPLHIDVISSSRRLAGELDKVWPPEECEEVFFVGLMMQHQGQERNFPVVRMGHIALNTDELIDVGSGPSCYRLIESQSYRGNSGAPVWAYYGDTKDGLHCFLGILSLGFGSEAEIIEKNRYYNYGISAVVPGEYLTELLNHLEDEKSHRHPPDSDRGTPLDVTTE